MGPQDHGAVRPERVILLGYCFACKIRQLAGKNAYFLSGTYTFDFGRESRVSLPVVGYMPICEPDLLDLASCLEREQLVQRHEFRFAELSQRLHHGFPPDTLKRDVGERGYASVHNARI